MAAASKPRRPRSQRGVSEIAQFVPVLYVLFLISLLPMIDLVALFVGAATDYLATNDIVSKAATQADYPTALSAMLSEADAFENFGLAKFVNLAPDGGFTGCGVDLYVLGTDGTGAVTSSSADLPPAQPILAANSYEMTVKSSYSVSPLVSLSAVPFLGAVPGLGQPVELTFSASRPVEHPGGLQVAGGGGGGGGGGGSVTPFARTADSPNTTGPTTSSTWRTPSIFSLIQQAGQTVVSDNVLVVYGNLAAWQPTGLVVNPGQKLWIDTQAIGIWSYVPLAYAATFANPQYVTAAGVESGYPGASPPVCVPPAALFDELVGSLGGGSVSANNNSFPVGDTLLNYTPTGTGPFELISNQDPLQWQFIQQLGGTTINSAGAQLVRVIVTQ